MLTNGVYVHMRCAALCMCWRTRTCVVFIRFNWGSCSLWMSILYSIPTSCLPSIGTVLRRRNVSDYFVSDPPLSVRSVALSRGNSDNWYYTRANSGLWMNLGVLFRLPKSVGTDHRSTDKGGSLIKRQSNASVPSLVAQLLACQLSCLEIPCKSR